MGGGFAPPRSRLLLLVDVERPGFAGLPFEEVRRSFPFDGTEANRQFVAFQFVDPGTDTRRRCIVADEEEIEGLGTSARVEQYAVLTPFLPPGHPLEDEPAGAARGVSLLLIALGLLHHHL